MSELKVMDIYNHTSDKNVDNWVVSEYVNNGLILWRIQLGIWIIY